MSTQTFQVVWRILDLDQTRRELEATAAGDLPDMLFEAGLQAVSDARWHVEVDPPQLVAEFEVERWVDPVKTRRRAVVA